MMDLSDIFYNKLFKNQQFLIILRRHEQSENIILFV